MSESTTGIDMDAAALSYFERLIMHGDNEHSGRRGKSVIAGGLLGLIPRYYGNTASMVIIDEAAHVAVDELKWISSLKHRDLAHEAKFETDGYPDQTVYVMARKRDKHDPRNSNPRAGRQLFWSVEHLGGSQEVNSLALAKMRGKALHRQLVDAAAQTNNPPASHRATCDK